MLPEKLDVSLPDMPFLADHAILGKAIVPAVEVLDFLLKLVDEHTPPRVPLGMRDVVFPRFLPGDEISRCTFEVGLAEVEHGVRATFSSRITLPNGMQRSRVHAEATFGGEVRYPQPPVQKSATYELAAERVYRELIPFGPQFCNLRGTLRLAREGAWGDVESPAPPHPNPSRAGCPYLLDSAMHLACVWGQRFAGLIAYPTGFSARVVRSAIPRGRRRCVTAPRGREARQLGYDLWLIDDEGRVCDAIIGLTMAPVAAGPPPPAWIVEAG
jgi:hypothetical protein